MKKNKLLLTLLLPLLIGVSACTTEEDKKPNNDSSSQVVSIQNSTSQIISSESSSSNKVSTNNSNSIDNKELPEETLEFINAVNSIVMNEQAGIYINEAYVLYDNLGEDPYYWDYEEAHAAFAKLGELEAIYNNYLKFTSLPLSFIEKVDLIPYELTLADERYIIAAEDTYARLTDDQKEVLGVSQAYERMVDAREDFTLLFAAIQEAERNAQAKEFIDYVALIPEVDLITLNHEKEILDAKNCYLTLSDEVKEMENVKEAYTKLEQSITRYEELLENPSINDDAIAASFVETVNKLPSVENVTLSDRVNIFAANDMYKALPATTKVSAKESYDKLQTLIKAYYDLYLTANGVSRPVVDNTNVTLISTKDEFLAIANNLSGNYRLANDIDLENMDWNNLGVFTGTLDGAGHTIYNLASTTHKDATFGLFLENRGTVKNLTIEGKLDNAGAWAGIIAVRNYGLISNCILNVEMNSSGHIGGIVCENHIGGVISNCIILSKVNGAERSGGLAAGNYGSITNTYFIKANVNTGLSIGNSNGLIPSSEKTDAELKQSSLYANFDKSIWCIVDGQYPTLVV